MNVATHLSTSRQAKERKLLQSARVSTVCWESGSIGKERGPSGRSYGDTAAGVRFENEAAGFGHEMKRPEPSSEQEMDQEQGTAVGQVQVQVQRGRQVEDRQTRRMYQ